MHLLFVAGSFPAPGKPYRVPFLGTQIRLLCEQLDRITVLSPTTYIPMLMRRFLRVATQVSLPNYYGIGDGPYKVLFPRYLKAPGYLFLWWTIAQWRRIIDQTVAQFARTYPVSVIHANVGGVVSWASICVARHYQIPCVVSYQGSEVNNTLAQRRKGWQLCRDSFRLADLNLPVSRSLEDILRRDAEPTGRCEVLIRGVDQTLFFPATELTAQPRVLFVGSIETAKGVFDLLTAWTNVRRSCPDALLTVVGQDGTSGQFAREARFLGIENSITLTGPLTPSEVAHLMRQSRILCLPSHAEGTPNCVMEALACGLPVVATRVGGIPDIIEHEKIGLLVNKGDIEGLAAALTTLFRDPSRCVRMGKAAQTFAHERLDARKTINRLVALYGELITDYAGKRLELRTIR